MSKLKYINLLFIAFLFACNIKSDSTSILKEKEPETKNTSQNTSKKITVLDLTELYKGNTQSPINLDKSLSKPSSHDISFHIDNNLNALNIKHHTLEIELNHSSYISVDNKHYEFKQLHFHTPSEHSVNNVIVDMEMHIVSVYKKESMKKPNYLVMGIMFKEGKPNKFIADLLKNIPRVKQHSYEIPTSVYNPLNLDDLFGKTFESHVSEFYYYNGSLTTYPFTETVDWYVLNEVVEASSEQIKAMKKQMGNNAREIQEAIL